MSGRQAESKTRIWRRARGPILIVDDDMDDAGLTKRAVESLRPAASVRVIQSGKELINYLEGQEPYADRAAHPLPAVVLLDLRMPEMDGFAVLEWVKNRADYAQIPIVAVSGLSDSEHMKRAFALMARSYLFKPISMDSLHGTLSSLNILF